MESSSTYVPSNKQLFHNCMKMKKIKKPICIKHKHLMLKFCVIVGFFERNCFYI